MSRPVLDVNAQRTPGFGPILEPATLVGWGGWGLGGALGGGWGSYGSPQRGLGGTGCKEIRRSTARYSIDWENSLDRVIARGYSSQGRLWANQGIPCTRTEGLSCTS